MYLLQTENLTYKFSAKDCVLNTINLHVAEKSIYGFLGPNGAGKTTTLRLLLGLLQKQQGEIIIFGKPFAAHRIECLKRIGSLIESPSLYAHLTAFENLSLLQKVYRCPKHRIQEVLNLVDLPHTGNKKVSQFSLGMKQRLSIAISLLHSPELLILDEPTNGLDPNGMIEIRELLKKLNKEYGITIIISSHLLSEIEKLVSHLGIINKGHLVFQGTLDELKSRQQKQLAVVFETSDPARALHVISDYNHVAKIENGLLTLPVLSKQAIAELNNQLVKAGIDVYEIKTMRNDLESIFMDFINK